MANAIAQTILAQLGGSKFIAMTGAGNFTAGPTSLNFKIGRNAKGVTHITIGLNDADLYDVQFYKCRGLDVKSLGLVEGVYADGLVDVVADRTGLAVRL